MNFRNNLRLFDEKTELIFLAVPLLVVAAIPLELIFFGPLFSYNESLAYSFILNALFFNTTHVALTYLMLSQIPEMKAWVLERSGGHVFKFWLPIAALCVLFFLIFSLPKIFKIESPLFDFLMGALAVLPMQHALWQVRGLSLAYNQGLRTQTELASFQKSERYEKSAFYVFFTAVVWIKIFKTEYFRFRWGLEFGPYFLGLFWVLVAGAGLLLIRALQLMPQLSRSNKPIYLLRLLAFPLVNFSFFAATATTLLHGLEYVCVFTKMNSSSVQDLAARRRVFKIGMGLLAVYALVFLVMRSTEDNNLLMFLGPLSSALVFVHYYLDRIIFRMRNSESRKWVSPLLSTK